jgi:hypothetical protein
MKNSLLIVLIFILGFSPILSNNPEKDFLKIDTDRFYTKAFVLGSPTEPAIILLVGVVHIGEGNYYQTIQELLEQCDIVFYEGIQWEEGSEISPLVKGTTSLVNPASGSEGLGKVREIQMEYAKLLGLVYQNSFLIPRFNWVNADASLQEFTEMMNAFKGGNLILDKKDLPMDIKDIRVLEPHTKDGNQKIMKFRRLLADEISTSSIQINSDKEYSEVFELLVQKRNQIVLRKITPQIKKPSVIGMVYGAAHIPDFLKKLNQGWDYQVINQRWIPAWSLE